MPKFLQGRWTGGRGRGGWQGGGRAGCTQLLPGAVGGCGRRYMVRCSLVAQ